jgi:transposase InsO family protein
MQERQRLIQAQLTGRYSVTELARGYNVSRKTAYKWLARYALDGPAGLKDRSHAAHSHPNATPQAVVDALRREKFAHPTWGPLKLMPSPSDPPEVRDAWPAPSTRGAILARLQLTNPRRRRRRIPPNPTPLAACDRPNAVWCIDFKGWFRTQDGQRCDPLTVTDACSRLLLCCEALPRPDYDHVCPVLERLFRQYGLPEVIRSDNGPPFASRAVGGLSRLSVGWLKLGIRPERIAPGHPEQNGRHERMHRTLKQECCRAPAANLAAQQARFDAFRYEFNQRRPHQALGQQPPAAFYIPSPRLYPGSLPDLAYPPGTQLRRVRSNGEIRWRGRLVFISEALVGELVGVREGDVGYEVYCGPVRLGNLDARKEKLVP